jgi:NAD-dependent deacetylase
LYLALISYLMKSKTKHILSRLASWCSKRKNTTEKRQLRSQIKAAADLIRGAQRVVVLTGAGMSAESGIATFRAKVGGVWQQFDPSEVATPQAFKNNPLRVLEWHQSMRKICRGAQPNAGHHAIAQMQDLFPEVIVLTQNIDNLHQRAGNKFVLELHGNLFRMKGFCDPAEHGPNRSTIHCPVCRGCTSPPVIWQPVHREAIVEFTEIVDGEVASCPHCGGPLRPDIVWFNEALDPYALDVAWRMADECDVMLVVGASLQVQPASGIPWRSAYKGVKVIEINPEPADATGFWTMRIPEKAAVALPQLVLALGATT